MNLNDISNEVLILELNRRFQEKEVYQTQINQLSHELKIINKRLSESESLKGHFISNIRNELINPFTSVLALAENILGVEKENWKKVISMVALIHTEVFNLDFQLKNIFAAAKFEAGETNLEVTQININSLIEHLVSAIKYESRRKHLQIEYHIEGEEKGALIQFKSDVEKIHLLLSNLLNNAIKFSYAEGKIFIKAHKHGKTLQISVQDFGQGISKANEQIIFDRFKRLDSGINSINRGHGLGLSIVKAIMDLLDGKIQFSSTLGKGTTFILTINESDLEVSGISSDVDEIYFKEEEF